MKLSLLILAFSSSLLGGETLIHNQETRNEYDQLRKTLLTSQAMRVSFEVLIRLNNFEEKPQSMDAYMCIFKRPNLVKLTAVKPGGASLVNDGKTLTVKLPGESKATVRPSPGNLETLFAEGEMDGKSLLCNLGTIFLELIADGAGSPIDASTIIQNTNAIRNVRLRHRGYEITLWYEPQNYKLRSIQLKTKDEPPSYMEIKITTLEREAKISPEEFQK